MCHVTSPREPRTAPYNEMVNVSSLKFINAHSVWVNVYKYFCVQSDQLSLANEFRSDQVSLEIQHFGFLRLQVFAYISINI